MKEGDTMKKMKRWIKALLMLCLVVSLIPVTARAATTGTCGDGLTWTLDDEGTLTISGTGPMYSYTRASRVPWYSQQKSIKTIILEKGVSSIGDYNFYGCENLTSITVPDGVYTVGDRAFYGCKSLTSVNIPDGVGMMGSDTFNGCSSLTSVNIPDSIVAIGSSMFWGCSSLTSIHIPDSVTDIGNLAFRDCSKLSSITIGNGVTRIGYGAFQGCTSLTSIHIPDSVTSFGDLAFYGCSKLSSINIPESVTCISRSMFDECSSLTGITIPNNVTSIGEFAFQDCSSLTGVTIPDGVTGIGRSAFKGCSSLTSIAIPDSIIDFGHSVFKDCFRLRSVIIPDGFTHITSNTFEGCSNLTDINIPDSVCVIGSGAFSGCSSLTSINIPNSVTSISTFAFYECSSLTSITIPDSMTSIERCTFQGCSSLSSVTSPSSIESIDEFAFYKCYEIKDIYYGGNAAEWEYLERYRPSATYVHYECTDSVAHWTEDVKEATCEEAGYSRLFCDCGYEKNNATTAALSHDMCGWVTTVEPSCTKSGTKIRSCKRDGCDHTETGTVKALGHNYKNATCSVCGDKKITVAAPTVKVSGVSSTGKNKVSWSKVTGASKYEVWYATSKTGTYKRATTTSKTSYTHSGAKAGTTYYYYVRAVDSNGGKSEKSNIVNRTCDLAQPTIKLSNVASTGKIKVSWEKIEGAVKYEVWRATSKNGTYKRITTTTNTSVTNTSVEAGKTYYYKVVAVAKNTAANSAASAVKSLTCDLAQPKVSITTSSGKPKVSWKKVTGATKYEVYRATSKSGTYSKVKTTTSLNWKDTSAQKGKNYYYKVVAVCKTTAGNSAFSAVKSIKATK